MLAKDALGLKLGELGEILKLLVQSEYSNLPILCMHGGLILFQGLGSSLEAKCLHMQKIL